MNEKTPARPELPSPDLIGNKEYYLADTVRQLVADERRKALLDAAWAARSMSSGKAAQTAIHRLIDKEPTT